MRPADRALLATDGLEQLIQALWARDYEVVGPRVRDGAIVYDTIRSARELPRDVTDEQEAGRYRLKPRGDGLRFGYAVGPHSWKRFLHPPLLTLWRARRKESGFELLEDQRRAAALRLRRRAGPASCERSRSRIGCCSRPRTAIPPTAPVVRRRSSWR